MRFRFTDARPIGGQRQMSCLSIAASVVFRLVPLIGAVAFNAAGRTWSRHNETPITVEDFNPHLYDLGSNFFHLRRECVTAKPNCLQQGRLLWIRLNFLSQPANVNIDTPFDRSCKP
jgi:hypothetical protein